MNKFNKFFIVGIIGTITGIGVIDSFSNVKNEIIESKKEDRERYTGWSRESLPYDFFGDWTVDDIFGITFTIDNSGEESGMEFPDRWKRDEWIDEHEDEISNIDYFYVDAKTGNGLETFKEYTRAFNSVVANGTYSGFYDSSYHEFAVNNPNGVYTIDPNWTVLNFAKYMEDWIVWNENTNVNPGVGVTNDDVSFRIYSNGSYTIDGDESWGSIKPLLDYPDAKMKDHQFDQIGIHNGGVFISFDDYPTYDWDYDNISHSYEYSHPRLEERIFYDEDEFNSNKQSIEKEPTFNEIYNYLHFEQWRSNTIYQLKFEGTNVIGHPDRGIYDAFIDYVNKDFIEIYGYGELGHDRLNGLHSMEDIRMDDLIFNISGLLDEEWVDLNGVEYDDYLVEDFKEINVHVETDSSSKVAIANEVFDSTFVVDEIWPVNTIPPNPDNNSLSSLAITGIIFGILIIIVIIGLVIYSLTKRNKFDKKN